MRAGWERPVVTVIGVMVSWLISVVERWQASWAGRWSRAAWRWLVPGGTAGRSVPVMA
ncbi:MULTISPECIES: hypothetical protein [unclassified Frankia]|uniref:hypothetical protein n=1 Tax=unclassified Frankia TaxID=2632575 RepID=UPI002AD5040C|nr:MULTISPECIES: hypothetical protein [unclassified Frankia]